MGQAATSEIGGKVSFISPQNIYVKFPSTGGISKGDTLFLRSNGNLVPVLTVLNLSSSSCVCRAISARNMSVGDNIVARAVKSANAREKAIPGSANQENTAGDPPATTPVKKPKTDGLTQRINGSISAYSYTNFSNTAGPNSQSFRYTLNMNALNIANSKFSIESYISFRHKQGDWETVKSDLFNALKIYNLALVYDPDKTTRISIGRRINPKLANIGASDGLQFEKSFKGFSFGALAGYRPDYTDYGFNSKLLQFGGYMALSSKKQDAFSESSVAFMQQMNGSNIDRRFLYFQHSNSFIRNLYFIGTFEVDLYQLKFDSLGNETRRNNFDPTGLYLSLRYRFSNRLSISASYDARKNVVYYETYKTFIDRILETEMRQGFRFYANYRITNNLTFGVQGGYRYLKADPHPSKNIYGYLTYSQIPGVNVSVTLTGTWLESSYMNGPIYGATVSRDLLNGKLTTSIGYQYVDYRLPESSQDIRQNIGEINLYWQFARKMSFGINYEGTFEQQNKYSMLYLQIRKRF